MSATPPNIFIGIDPSINHTGWAVLRWCDDGKPLLKGSGTIKQSSSCKHARFGRLALRLAFEVGCLIGGEDRKRALSIIERPTYEDSAEGLCLARQKHLPTLFGAATVAISTLSLLGIPEYAFVSASQWKRDVPKLKIQALMERMFPAKAGAWATEDEWEAVALAVWGEMRFAEGAYEVWRPEIR